MRRSRKIRPTNRKHWLILTIHSGAIAKIPLLILFQLQKRTNLEITRDDHVLTPVRGCCKNYKIRAHHLCNASVCEDVTCMYKSVQHLCCLLYQVALVWIIFKLLICLNRNNLTCLTILLSHFMRELVCTTLKSHLAPGQESYPEPGGNEAPAHSTPSG